MTEQKKERKRNLLTVRLTDEETDALEYLSDYMGKSKSDIMVRACKYLLSAGAVEEKCGYEGGSGEGRDDKKKEKMTTRVHVRIPDSDMDRLKSRGTETGHTVSQLVRKAITALASVTGRPY